MFIATRIETCKDRISKAYHNAYLVGQNTGYDNSETPKTVQMIEEYIASLKGIEASLWLYHKNMELTRYEEWEVKKCLATLREWINEAKQVRNQIKN